MSCVSGAVPQIGHFGEDVQSCATACMLLTGIVCLTIELTSYPCLELLLQKTFESHIYLFIYSFISVCVSQEK